MPYFKWKGKNIEGKIIRGEIIATDKNEAISKLSIKKIAVISVSPAPKDIYLPFVKKVKDIQLATITRQIGEMLKSGLTIDDALRIVAEQTTNKYLGEILYNIRDKIREGSSVSQAIRSYPHVFSETYVGIIKSSEQTGDMDMAFLRLADMLEKRVELKRKVKSSLIYPTILFVVAVVVITIIMTVAIPMFAKMYASSGLKLPFLTLLVIKISKAIKQLIIPFILASILLAVIFRVAYKRVGKFRYTIDYLILKMPVVGKIVRKVSLSGFSSVFASLHNSGVDILDALQLSSESIKNSVIKSKILKVRNFIKDGEMLSTAMSIVGEFTDMVIQMVYVGEESGKIGDMLGKVAEYYQKDVDAMLKNLTNMVEPAIILFMGSVVGFLVVSMYLPIFKIGEAIK